MKRVVRKPRTCSACGAKRIAKTVFGLPYFSEEKNRQIELGKIVLEDVFLLETIQHGNAWIAEGDSGGTDGLIRNRESRDCGLRI